jgi:uridine kinase
MKGDKIIVQEHHVGAARKLSELLMPEISARRAPFVLTIAGESGSGKSETAAALGAELTAQGLCCLVLQQDDYFIYPPKTNDRTRRNDIDWVGPGEVRLSLLDENLDAIKGDAVRIEKPLVDYDADTIGEESIDLVGVQVVIVEGTYTTLLKNVDRRIFIDRTREYTRAARVARGREAQDDYLERVLDIEHGIISAHKDRADIVITRDYEVIRAGA